MIFKWPIVFASNRDIEMRMLSVPSLDKNRIFARWLQKRMVFRKENDKTVEGNKALGPDTQLLEIRDKDGVRGTLSMYEDDGKTLLAESSAMLVPGRSYRLVFQNSSRRRNNLR